MTAPVPTVVANSTGTWVTLPMGHLDDPLNTFWQLLYRPAGSSHWTDQVEATAAATNSGLALAATGGRAVVAVRPSDRLVFSPLIDTTNGGQTWQNGLLPEGVTPITQSVATGPDATIAAVNTGPEIQIL
ncbi:MAG TPA: hypothetical protein VGH89_25945, partial [Pseudonocardia sp.]